MISRIRQLGFTLCAVTLIGCDAFDSPTSPSPSPASTPAPPPGPASSGNYQGRIGFERIEWDVSRPNGFFYHLEGRVRLTFTPSIPAAYPFSVSINDGSLNNAYFDRGWHNSHGGGSVLTVRIGGDIWYLPWCRSDQ